MQVLELLYPEQVKGMSEAEGSQEVRDAA